MPEFCEAKSHLSSTNNREEKYVSVGMAAKMLGVSIGVLRKWDLPESTESAEGKSSLKSFDPHGKTPQAFNETMYRKADWSIWNQAKKLIEKTLQGKGGSLVSWLDQRKELLQR